MASFVLDASDHGEQAVRALSRERVFQTEAIEERLRIDAQYFFRCAA